MEEKTSETQQETASSRNSTPNVTPQSSPRKSKKGQGKTSKLVTENKENEQPHSSTQGKVVYNVSNTRELPKAGTQAFVDLVSEALVKGKTLSEECEKELVENNVTEKVADIKKQHVKSFTMRKFTQ